MNSFTVPIGFKFLPTSQEILIHYLKPKIYGEIEKLPPNNIREVDIYSYHPSELFKDLQHNDDEYEIERYFYTTLKKVSKNGFNGRNYVRKIKDVGKWDGEYPKEILDDHGEVIGFDKYFKFVSVKKDSNKTEEWNMHEYSFKQELIPQCIDEEKKNLVVCRMVKIVKGNRLAKNNSRVIRLRCAQPRSFDGSDVNMISNYAFSAEQEEEPSWKKQQPSDQIILNNSEDSTNFSSNVDLSYGTFGSTNVETMGEGFELCNGYDLDQFDQIFDYEFQCPNVLKEDDFFLDDSFFPTEEELNSLVIREFSEEIQQEDSTFNNKAA